MLLLYVNSENINFATTGTVCSSFTLFTEFKHSNYELVFHYPCPFTFSLLKE